MEISVLISLSSVVYSAGLRKRLLKRNQTADPFGKETAEVGWGFHQKNMMKGDGISSTEEKLEADVLQYQQGCR